MQYSLCSSAGWTYTPSLHTPAVPQSTHRYMPLAVSYYGLQTPFCLISTEFIASNTIFSRRLNICNALEYIV